MSIRAPCIVPGLSMIGLPDLHCCLTPLLASCCHAGSEICCSGTPYSNLTAVAAKLKTGLPDAWIYTNECSEMARWPKLDPISGHGGVPPGLDAISVVRHVAYSHAILIL